MSYRIKTVAEMLGVPRNTIVAWERRLGILAPNRTEGGYRLYSPADVALLARLKELMDSGLKVSEAWSVLQEEREAGRPIEPSRVPMGDLRAGIYAALLRWDRERADALAVRALMVPWTQQVDELIMPMLIAVGEDWATGVASVAQEHFVSGWCRERLHLMLHAAGSQQAGGREVTLATPPGEHHDLGLLALAIKLVARGFRVVWLGAEVPAAELARHAEERGVFGVCLSMVQERSVDEVIAWTRDLRRRLPPSVRLAIGGPATHGLDPSAIGGVTICGRDLPPWASS
ncbi:MAG TPA: cobalamin B12-binding domain-containing protein [Myxococcota bacterium]|nr:cobalamin B12-binding domain-containing protein [Myxococcota bacterium]